MLESSDPTEYWTHDDDIIPRDSQPRESREISSYQKGKETRVHFWLDSSSLADVFDVIKPA